MRHLLVAALLTLAACSPSFVEPEDPRCTLYVAVDEPAEITRWQIDHCERVRVFVVLVDGTVVFSYETEPR